jgi:hypothetical protein
MYISTPKKNNFAGFQLFEPFPKNIRANCRKWLKKHTTFNYAFAYNRCDLKKLRDYYDICGSS